MKKTWKDNYECNKDIVICNVNCDKRKKLKCHLSFVTSFRNTAAVEERVVVPVQTIIATDTQILANGDHICFKLVRCFLS